MFDYIFEVNEHANLISAVLHPDFGRSWVGKHEIISFTP